MRDLTASVKSFEMELIEHEKKNKPSVAVLTDEDDLIKTLKAKAPEALPIIGDMIREIKSLKGLDDEEEQKVEKKEDEDKDLVEDLPQRPNQISGNPGTFKKTPAKEAMK